jgi:hypothetical protein
MGILEIVKQYWRLALFFIGLGAIVYSVFYFKDRVPILAEFLVFLKERKLWWMTPIALILVLIGLLIILTESSALAPLIYAIF